MLRGGGVSDGYIEARPRGVSKGLFVNHAVATMKANNHEPDFILAIGEGVHFNWLSLCCIRLNGFSFFYYSSALSALSPTICYLIEDP